MPNARFLTFILFLLMCFRTESCDQGTLNPQSFLGKVTLIDGEKLMAETAERALRGVDTSEEKVILLYGGLGSLADVFLKEAFVPVRRFFPKARFMIVDVRDPGREADLIRNRLDKIGLPLWSQEAQDSYLVSSMEPGGRPVLKDWQGNRLPVDGNGILTLGNLQKLKVSGVIASLPTHLHFPVADGWSDLNVPVWVEKPLVLSSEIDQIKSRASKNPGTIFAADFALGNLALLWLLDQGEFVLNEIGPIRGITSRWVYGVPQSQAQNFEATVRRHVPKGREWLLDPDKSGGGMGMDLGPHPLAFMALILNRMGLDLGSATVDAAVRANPFIEGFPKNAETYFWAKGRVGGVQLHVDAGIFTDEKSILTKIDGERGAIELFYQESSHYQNPSLHVQPHGIHENGVEERLFIFNKAEIGYAMTFLDYLLVVYGAQKNIRVPLETRLNITASTVAFIDSIYEHSNGMTAHPLGRLPAGVSGVDGVRPSREILEAVENSL